MTNRYTVRKEYFGGLLYDFEEDAYIAVDKKFYDALKHILIHGSVECLSKSQYDMFCKEGILKDGKPSYRIIEKPHTGHNLSSPVRIHFCYTQLCNLNCGHCFTKQQKTAEELSFDMKVNMLDELSELGISEILVGGGEPFMKMDFISFIKECNRRDINIKVFTNGLLFDRDIVDELSRTKIKYLSVSVDGTTDDEYDAIRGVKGLNTIKNNIALLKEKCSFPICISITINRYNYRKAEEYLKLACQMNIDRIKVRPTKPGGNVLLNRNIYPSPEQYLQFICAIQKIWNEQYADKLRLDYSWGDTRLKYDEKKDQMVVINNPFPYEGYGCFAGKGSMVIRADGGTSPCGFLPEKMQICKSNNIKEKGIKEIWDSGLKFNALRGWLGNEKCRNCQYYAVCRGGCIARTLYAKKMVMEPDPWCLAKYFPARIQDYITGREYDTGSSD